MVAPPRVLLTAGPTHEPIDRVRYIANRSSGRMGMALAEAAVKRGWPTTLLLGPAPISPPESPHLRIVRFQTTADLQRLLADHWPQHDVLIMAAAVADFAPVQADSKAKLARGESLTLELRPTPDLLAGLAAVTRPDQRIIGFALEPVDRLLASAKAKLADKKLDAIVANPLETMDADRVTASVFFSDGHTAVAPANLLKTEFAQWLIQTLENRGVLNAQTGR